MLHVIATYAKRQRALTISLGSSLAILYVVFAVLQLVSFEKLPPIVASLWGIKDEEIAHVVVAKLAIAEVFALPFLLGMQLSKLMRLLSGLLAFSAAFYWLAVGLRTSGEAVVVANTAIGGGFITIPGGAWLLWFSIGIIMLLAWYTARLVLESRD